MKQFIKKIGKKTALVVVSALIAGTGATMAAFAAIPHSTTGVIAGCYTNATGAMRVIDTENSATCDGSETAVSWSSATTDGNTAALRLEADPNDETNYVMNSSRSRNVLAVNTIDLNDNRYLCIKVAFRPEVKVVNSDNDQMGGGATIDLRVPAPGSDFAAGVEGLCGTGYNVISFLTSGSPVNSQSILFSN